MGPGTEENTMMRNMHQDQNESLEPDFKVFQTFAKSSLVSVPVN